MLTKESKKIICICLLVLLLPNIVSASVYPVSLVQLLVTPEKYDGKDITVIGYLKHTITLQLYLTRDHANMLDKRSSITILDNTSDGSLLQSSCAPSYVQIRGTFKRIKYSMYVIYDVKEVLQMDNLKICYNRNIN